jgi:hypothetical protein
MQQYRIKRPPRALRRPGVRLDNVALVAQVSAHLKRKGYRVRTLPAERFTEPEDKIHEERPSGASPRFVLVFQCAR